MNLSAAIRAYLSAQSEPRLRDDIVAALNADPMAVKQSLARMVVRGMLVAQDLGYRSAYSIGRPLMVRERDPAAKTRRRERDRLRKQRKRGPVACKPVPARLLRAAEPARPIEPRGQSVEEYLAQGGHIQRIPAGWEQRASA